MSDQIHKLVDFLIKENALRLGDSPWPTVDPDHSVENLDWEKLYPPFLPRQDDDEWSPKFSDEFLGQIDSALDMPRPTEADGASSEFAEWDVCAWYQPVHFFGHNWGIFIREECVERLAIWIARFLPGHPGVRGQQLVLLAKDLVRAAVYAYFLHEQYHHKVECLGFRLHVVDRTSRYLPYHAMVYQRSTGTDDQLEEALANANMFLRLLAEPYRSRIPLDVLEALRAYLKWSFPHDPPGYRRAQHYLRSDDFDAGENLLHGQVKEATLTPAQPTSDWELAPRLLQSFFSVKSDIWTLLPQGRRSILPTAATQPVRTCSTRDMVTLFERAGYQLVPGGKGSHVKLSKPGSPTMILPGNRRELSQAVAKTAVRVLGDFTLHDLPKLLEAKRSIQAHD